MGEVLIAVIGFVGGLAAGVINTLAGNGSAITLGILTDLMGLPANIANGTNRIGVFAQSIASSYQMVSKNRDVVSRHRWIVLLTVGGAVIGVVIATMVSNEQFKFVYKYIMLVMLILILVKPAKWIRESASSDIVHNPWIMFPLTFVIGIYGGFIQLGMGIFYLATLVLIGNLGMKVSNILKNFVVGIFTGIALLIFISNGMVDWKAGFFIASGQALGGYLGGKYAVNSKYASVSAYWILLAVILTVLVKQFLFTS